MGPQSTFYYLSSNNYFRYYLYESNILFLSEKSVGNFIRMSSYYQKLIA